MLVILDSSMLMLPLETRINLSLEIKRLIQSNFEIVIPKIIIEELENLVKETNPSTQHKARFALSLAENFKILDSRIDTHADEELERLADEYQAIIATNDTLLRKRLRKKGRTVISLRGKNRLSLFGHI